MAVHAFMRRSGLELALTHVRHIANIALCAWMGIGAITAMNAAQEKMRINMIVAPKAGRRNLSSFMLAAWQYSKSIAPFDLHPNSIPPNAADHHVSVTLLLGRSILI
jgi:hypothetical protein